MGKTATFIKTLKDWKGDARFYRLSHPLEDEDGESTDYVVVSAVDALESLRASPFASFLSAPDDGDETFIFAASKKGVVSNWGELAGSFKGAQDHVRALENAGYTVV